jgi:hypothetical protein
LLRYGEQAAKGFRPGFRIIAPQPIVRADDQAEVAARDAGSSGIRWWFCNRPQDDKKSGSTLGLLSFYKSDFWTFYKFLARPLLAETREVVDTGFVIEVDLPNHVELTGTGLDRGNQGGNLTDGNHFWYSRPPGH